jgi:hypothetical protein
LLSAGTLDSSHTLDFYVHDGDGFTLSCGVVDANASISAVTMTLWGSGIGDTSPTNWYRVPINTTTSVTGAATYRAFTASWTAADGLFWQWSFDSNGNQAMRAVFSATGGAAADTLTVDLTEFRNAA